MTDNNKANIIKFGTDGWRGEIAADFTFENVRRVASGLARHIKTKRAVGQRPVIVGYDRRFLSEEFALSVARTAAAQGLAVIVSDGAVTTPCVSFSAADKKAAYGVMITASHNPPFYNGIKFKTSGGASAPKSVTDAIEKLIPSRAEADRVPTREPRRFDLTSPYVEKIRRTFAGNCERTGKNFKLAFNPMHGPAAGLLQKILATSEIAEFNADRDPLFGGINPEPIEKNLVAFAKATADGGFEAGFAVDGDGDRIGVIDDTGRYLAPHMVFPIFLEHLLKNPKTRGCAAQGFALGYISRRIARAYGVKIIDTPVGFKYIADELQKNDCVIGAEESGGVGFGSSFGYIPERDGLAAAVFAAGVIAMSGRKLSRIADDISARYGASHYERLDLRLREPVEPRRIYEAAERRFRALKNVGKVDRLDGIKFIFPDESWLLVRASGTEPVVRIYCETPDARQTRKLVREASETARATAGL